MPHAQQGQGGWTRQGQHERQPAEFGPGPQALQPGQHASATPYANADSSTSRRSVFRRSLAFFGYGAGAPIAPIPDWPGTGGPAQTAGGVSATPTPRLTTMADASHAESPGVARKSVFLGGGAAGNEWDVNGYGSTFWKRFNSAQRRAEAGSADPINVSSEKWLRKERRGHRKLTCMATFFGLFILACVGCAVAWRVVHSMGGPKSGDPPALQKANLPMTGAPPANTDRNATSYMNANASSSSTDSDDASSSVYGDNTAPATGTTAPTAASDDDEADSDAESTAKQAAHHKQHHHHQPDDNSRRRGLRKIPLR